jgi:hypothetical protein
MNRGKLGVWTTVFLVGSAVVVMTFLLVFILPLPQQLWPGTIEAVIVQGAILVLGPVFMLVALSAMASDLRRARQRESEPVSARHAGTGLMESLEAAEARNELQQFAPDSDYPEALGQMWDLARRHPDDRDLVDLCARATGNVLCSEICDDNLERQCLTAIYRSIEIESPALIDAFGRAALKTARAGFTASARDALLRFIFRSRSTPSDFVQETYEVLYQSLSSEEKARALQLAIEKAEETDIGRIEPVDGDELEAEPAAQAEEPERTADAT